MENGDRSKMMKSSSQQNIPDLYTAQNSQKLKGFNKISNFNEAG